MTRAHQHFIESEGEKRGYAIRVGKRVPENTANLAYVHSQDISPESNLSIQSFTDEIEENSSDVEMQEYRVFPDEDFKLRTLEGEGEFSTRNVTITDEFSIPSSRQDTPTPLYFMGQSSGHVDARNMNVTPYKAGYQKDPVEENALYQSFALEQRHELLYMGNKITVRDQNGTDLDLNHRYKIKLIKVEGENVPPHSYRIAIYSNFRNNASETFFIHYDQYQEDGTKIHDHQEVFNAQPFFTEVHPSQLKSLAETPKEAGEWRSALLNKEFAVQKTEAGDYEVYAPSQVLVANQTTRPSHPFEYRISGDLQVKLSQHNPGMLNIGFAYIGESVFGVESLAGTMKKAEEDSRYRPSYLSFQNPRPQRLSAIKQDVDYWNIDLNMPEEYFFEYDLIIISGYSNAQSPYDMTTTNNGLRRFLEQGGRLWVDNAGEGSQVLSLENFFTNISFSEVNQVSGSKSFTSFGNESPSSSRLYPISQRGRQVGHPNVNPAIQFGSGESVSLWDTILSYPDGNPSVIKRKAFEKGEVLISNCGIFRSFLFNDREEVSIRFLINTLLGFAENKWVHSPWIKDHVYHRDNLFREEYQDPYGYNRYIDDRSQLNPNQIVAKKVIQHQTQDALMPYMDDAFLSSSGTYTVEVNANQSLALQNPRFEDGNFNATDNTYTTQWTTTTEGAIPGWSTSHVSGGAVTFAHVTEITQRGMKAISIESIGEDGAQAYWSTGLHILPEGDYRATAWIKTDAVDQALTGISIAAFTNNGVLLSQSQLLSGTRDWTRVELNINITESGPVSLRIGFVGGNGKGTAFMDDVSLVNRGSVTMSEDNDGSEMLYAYTVRPKPQSFDLSVDGFDYADVTIYDPDLEIPYIIRPYVYVWNNQLGRYVSQYGRPSRGWMSVRQSDGTMKIEDLSVALPELLSGYEWADKNRIFYEVSLGQGTQGILEQEMINIEIFDTDTGRYYYQRDGRHVIRHSDLYKQGAINQSIIIQAKTDYYTIRATKRRYGLKVKDYGTIALMPPSTIDNRDGWYLRIQNGGFTKTSLSNDEMQLLRSLGVNLDSYNKRHFGEHTYQVPEYYYQAFDKGYPFRKKRKEVAEYVNNRTLRVQNTPLSVKEDYVVGELARRRSSTVFQAREDQWLQDNRIKVYVDESLDGTYTEWTSGFRVQHEEGTVVFEQPLTGNVKVDYAYKNLRLYLRKYKSETIEEKRLTIDDTADQYTFYSGKRNWMRYPTPVVYNVPFGKDIGDEYAVNPSSYTINYTEGSVTFKEQTQDQVVIAFSYSKDEEVTIRDYDAESGLLYLPEPTHFRDEYYVNYDYREDFLHYKGYYDEQAGRFMHLDFNPMDGHEFTIKKQLDDERVVYERTSSAKLMNKEVYLYMVPYTSNFYGQETQPQEFTIRHCFGEEEWHELKKANPTYLLLGTIHLREVARVGDTTVLDTRQRGGGIKDSFSQDQIRKRDIRSLSHWDIGSWDGEAYYRNGVLVIRLPKHILQTYGGQFSEQQVKTVVDRYMAYGMYPIIEYVDQDMIHHEEGRTAYIQGPSYPSK